MSGSLIGSSLKSDRSMNIIKKKRPHERHHVTTTSPSSFSSITISAVMEATLGQKLSKQLSTSTYTYLEAFLPLVGTLLYRYTAFLRVYVYVCE